MTQHIRAPNDRIGVIIGQKGNTKKIIEEKGQCKLKIDSKTGMVQIYDAKDPLEELRTRDAIAAIARGFSPEKALRIMDEEELTLETINLSNIATNEKEIKRISSRIIGTNGRMREHIEKMTDCNISIYGKTISIIGKPKEKQKKPEFGKSSFKVLVSKCYYFGSQFVLVEECNCLLSGQHA
ncbi:RNA-processing protein [Methanosarcinales archaeon ex4484_138]|nr:MAG: RNA-processing protein [Methanosarcinales archaeon ex4484_138]